MIRAPLHHSIATNDRRKRHKSLFSLQRRHYAYAVFLTRVAIIFGVLFSGLCAYLLNNNYALFENIFLVYAPDVVPGLNRELHLTNLLLLGSLITYSFFMALLGLKISHKLIVPVYLIQEKMMAIAHGDFSQSKLTIRKSDDFQEYCETFNHMTENLKYQIEQDIQRLEKLKPDPKNHDATHIWELLMDEKKRQIQSKDETQAPQDNSDVKVRSLHPIKRKAS